MTNVHPSLNPRGKRPRVAKSNTDAADPGNKGSNRPPRSASDVPGVAAVNRAIQILTAFRSNDDGLPLGEISRRTGLYKSTILRLAESLEGHGLLDRDADGRFRLARELIRLGEMAKRMRRSSNVILLALEKIARETGESATFYVRQGDHRLALFRVDSPKSVRDHIRAGDLLPIGLGAAGHVITHYENAGGGAPRNRFEPVVSRGERDAEVAAVAGPVYAGAKFEGALSVSGPRSRLTEARIREISRIVARACEELTEQLS